MPNRGINETRHLIIHLELNFFIPKILFKYNNIEIIFPLYILTTSRSRQDGSGYPELSKAKRLLQEQKRVNIDFSQMDDRIP